jgi:hypothetical protein
MKTRENIVANGQRAFAALEAYAGRPLGHGEESEHLADILADLLHLVGPDHLAEAMQSAEHHAWCEYAEAWTGRGVMALEDVPAEWKGAALEDVRALALGLERKEAQA